MNTRGPTAVLLLSCKDQKGLVAAVADFIFRNNGNIVHADQHTDFELGIFLQRIEWELADFLIPREKLGEAFEPLASRFGITWRLHFSDHVPRMAVLVSKQAHCMYDLLAKERMGEFRAKIPLIVSNHPDLGHVAESFGIEYACFPVQTGSKQAQEQRMLELLDKHKVDLVILARYMQIVTDDFIARYRNRMINIHHSFLPACVGARPYNQAHERGVKIIGATAHYVTPELDQGPIIEQDVVRVSHRDTVADLVHKGKDLEKVVLARAVELHLNNRIIVYGNKTVVFG